MIDIDNGYEMDYIVEVECNILLKIDNKTVVADGVEIKFEKSINDIWKD